MRPVPLIRLARACRTRLPTLTLALAPPDPAQDKDAKGESPKSSKGSDSSDTKEKGKSEKGKVPEDLIGNEHVREEFGVNDFTTPSIRKIFDALDSLGT